MVVSCQKSKVVVVCWGGGALLAAYLLKKLASYVSSKREEQRFQKKCEEWPKDVVIVHGMRRGKLAPHPSPFVMKLETFLRMHSIPYIFDSEFPYGDKKKMPWITLNGENYTDSQLIIDFLYKKYNLKNADEGADDNEKALLAAATMARVMIDEHFFWGLLLSRYVYRYGNDVDKMFNFRPGSLKVFKKMVYAKYKLHSWYQGVGRHTQEEVVRIMSDDLRALSKWLGNKQFLLGDKPGDDDCAVFGMIAQLVWNDVSSPFSKLIDDELPNLKEYCVRMKERFWQDWDKVIEESLALTY